MGTDKEHQLRKAPTKLNISRVGYVTNINSQTTLFTNYGLEMNKKNNATFPKIFKPTY